MANSYGRRCRTCRRWISMRRMPHGQWVAFENDEPHKCEAVPAPAPRRPTPPRPAHIDPPDFPDIEIPEDVTEPVRPAPPAPGPVARPIPTRQKASPVSPVPRPRPSPPVNPPPQPQQPRPQPLGQTTPVPQRPTVSSPLPEVTAPARTKLTDVIAMGAYAIFTIYVMIGVLHSIAFSVFVSRVTCATTTKTIISIFCNTGMGISHLVAVIGWPWYWLSQ